MIKNKNDILKYNQRYVLEVLVDVFIRNANIKALLEELNRFDNPVLKNFQEKLERYLSIRY